MSGEDDALIGQVLLGRLHVLSRIGGGGMGSVYEVKHQLTGHHRALKVVRKKYANEPRFMKRLLREARVAGTLSSPYVVETLDAGRFEDGSAYVLMELLRGRSMLDLLRDKGRLEPDEVTWVGAQVCEGLRAAHEAGIIHRDLKPDNIFIVPTADGHAQVKILDFGVSKFSDLSDEPDRLTREGTILGTPYYMSPEQASGRKLDVRCDLYSLGVVLYEALSGRLPFEASTVGALFMKIGGGEYVPLEYRRPELDQGLIQLVHKAIHRDPNRRFQNAFEMQEALLPYCDGTLQAPGRATQRLAYMAQPERDRLDTVEFGSTKDRQHQRDHDSGPQTVDRPAGAGSVSSVPPPRTPSSFPPVPEAIGAAMAAAPVVDDESLPEPPDDLPLVQVPPRVEPLLPEGSSTGALGTVTGAHVSPPRQRMSLAVVGAAIVLVGAVVAASFVLREPSPVEPAPRRATPETPRAPDDAPAPVPIESIELVPVGETVREPLEVAGPSEMRVRAMRPRPRSEEVGLDMNPY